MAIDEIDDYPEKMTEFELHWQSVNAALGGTPETDLVLLGGYSLVDFSAERAGVVGALSDQEGLDNDLSFARSDRDQARADLRQRLILFRETVKALLPESRYLRALPATPAEQADQQKLLDAWDDLAHIWEQINEDQPAEVAPAMTLRGGYAFAQFQTDLAEMRTRYNAVKAAERAAVDGRGTRDDLLKSAMRRMVQYRERVPITLEPDNPLVASLPTISPSGGGSAPAPVTLSGEWQDPPGEAVLTWTASTASNLDHYEVRVSPGASYDSASATSADQTSPGTEELRTTEGLASPGDTASFKVFVVLSNGDEVGSNPVTVSRP